MLRVTAHQTHHNSLFLSPLEAIHTAHLHRRKVRFHQISDHTELAVIRRDDRDIILAHTSFDQIAHVKTHEGRLAFVDFAVGQQCGLPLCAVLGVFDLLGEVAALGVVVD